MLLLAVRKGMSGNTEVGLKSGEAGSGGRKESDERYSERIC